MSTLRRTTWPLFAAALTSLALTGIAGAGHDTTTAYNPANVLHLNVTNTQNPAGATTRWCDHAAHCLGAINLNTGESARGLSGAHVAATGTGAGVYGQTSSSTPLAVGLHGTAVAATTERTIGVLGDTDSTACPAPCLAQEGANGVLGRVNPTSAGAWSAGVRGQNNGTGADGIGVYGSHAGSGWGVYGTTEGAGTGVRGDSPSGVGVYGAQTGTAFGYGVRGVSSSTAAQAAGVSGSINSAAANAAGVRGQNSASACCGMGVFGRHTGNGIGVYGEAETGFAVSGFSPNNWSGYFQGDMRVVGNLQKNSGSFTIDHPLNPEGRYLSHSFVESPDMKNVYDGVTTTNSNGFATVKLPRYFQALNRDFRYQLTPIGELVVVAVFREIRKNRFVIRSAKPNVEVSWQVTGIRKDRWANAHRIVVEEPKKPSERGKYLNPELYGAPATRSVVVLPAMRGR